MLRHTISFKVMNIHELLMSKTFAMFKPVAWVRVRMETNGTCLFGGQHSWLSRHIFRIFVPCTGAEEIAPESTRILREKRRKNNNATCHDAPMH